MNVSRAELWDEVYELRGRFRVEVEANRSLRQDNEEMMRLLVQAETRIEELEAMLESATEQQEEPYV